MTLHLTKGCDQLANDKTDKQITTEVTRPSMLEFKDAVRDPLYGLIQLTSLELSILKTLPVTRMRWIKQMGLACLVFPGANHTRFEHSLGAMFVANKLTEALFKKTG